MKPYNKQIAADRLKILRDSRKWSQSKMGRELNALLGFGGSGIGKIELTGDTGKQRVSQFEKGKGITLDLAFAYAEIFDVSLDYIYGRTPNKKAEYAPIKEATGLSDGAVEVLLRKGAIVRGGGNRIDKELRHEDEEQLEVLSFIIENHIVESKNPLFADPNRDNLLELLYNYLLADNWFYDGDPLKGEGNAVDSIPLIRRSKFAERATLPGLTRSDINAIDWRKLEIALIKLREKVVRQQKEVSYNAQKD